MDERLLNIVPDPNILAQEPHSLFEYAIGGIVNPTLFHIYSLLGTTIASGRLAKRHAEIVQPGFMSWDNALRRIALNLFQYGGALALAGPLGLIPYAALNARNTAKKIDDIEHSSLTGKEIDGLYSDPVSKEKIDYIWELYQTSEGNTTKKNQIVTDDEKQAAKNELAKLPGWGNETVERILRGPIETIQHTTRASLSRMLNPLSSFPKIPLDVDQNDEEAKKKALFNALLRNISAARPYWRVPLRGKKKRQIAGLYTKKEATRFILESVGNRFDKSILVPTDENFWEKDSEKVEKFICSDSNRDLQNIILEYLITSLTDDGDRYYVANNEFHPDKTRIPQYGDTIFRNKLLRDKSARMRAYDLLEGKNMSPLMKITDEFNQLNPSNASNPLEPSNTDIFIKEMFSSKGVAPPLGREREVQDLNKRIVSVLGKKGEGESTNNVLDVIDAAVPFLSFIPPKIQGLLHIFFLTRRRISDVRKNRYAFS